MANVLSIVTYKIFPPKLGGQKGIALFNRYLSEKQNLYCFTIKDNDPSYPGYRVFNSLSNHSFRYINFFYYRKLKSIIKEHHITHVITEHPYYGWMGLLLKYFCKVKLIVHSHNIEAERFKTVGKWWWKILWYYERFIHRKADFTFCITENDRQYFLKKYKILSEKISVVTYGISWSETPSQQERETAKKQLLDQYNLQTGVKLFLFNGTLSYGPNLDAVKHILEDINPLLLSKKISYRIIICGKGLPGEMNELKEYASQNIIYAGFVDDISVYFKGADVFINPVTDGGGIKTKLVEALAYDLNVVSTFNGAIGVDENICNGKLFLCGNDDWHHFAKMMEALSVIQDAPVSPAFFRHFYWGNIAEKASGIINNL